jgi:Fe-S cluster assembly iron-binding protein IscA
LTLDESTDENDVVVISGGVKVVYEKDLENEIGDIVIDYQNKWYNRGFRIDGNYVSTC